MQVKKQQLILDMEKRTGSKSGKEYNKAVYCHPAYLTSMQSTPCKMPGWMNHKLQPRLPGEISATSDYADDTTLTAGSKELKSLLMRVEEESAKTGLKLSILKTKNMVSSPITSWQIEGKKVEAVTDFLLLGSEISVDGDCSHEIRSRLLLGRKAMTNLDSVLKNKDITLPTKVCIVKAMVFPVVMYRCEN